MFPMLHLCSYILRDSKNDDGMPIIDESDKAVLEALDLNGDGQLTVLDVTELQMYIAAQN